MGKEEKKEQLQRIIRDERYDLSAAPKDQSESEKNLLLERNVIQDRVRAAIEVLPEYKALDDDLQKKIMAKVAGAFRIYSLPEKMPAEMRAKRAEKMLETLRKLEEQGKYNEKAIVNRLIETLRKRAA